MSGTNSFENEVQALASIYGDDLHVQGNTLTIRVHSLQNDPGNEEIDAQIDLELCCPDNYPKELPEIAFKNCRGLSHKQVNTLTAQVEAYGITLKGNPMIFDLVCYVLDYLIDNNRPRKKSCYDEMMCRKEQELARFKLDEVRKMKKVCDVKRKVQEKLEENYSSDEDDFESKTQVISNDNFRDDYMKNTIIMCNPALCHCSKYIHFSNKVLRGQCIDHNECCISYCALDTTTGEQLIIHEWILKPGQQANNIQNILKSIENEFNYLKKLNHENLNSYVDFKCMKNDEKDEYVVYIAEKFVSMVTLNTFIKQSFIFDLEFVQFLVQSVLKAILYLHERKVVLKNLSENNIYFNKLGNFKIASYSTPKRMGDVYRLCQNEETEYTKSDQKTDIKHLGLILNDVMELTSKKNDNKGSNHKLVEFKDFIDKCLIKNEERRWGARELLDHDFLKSNSSYEATGTRRQSYSELTFETIDDADQDKIDLSVMEMNSRFPKDFTVLDTVGKGSFGTVWKVRNKLDRQIYAIKKIKLDKNSTDFDRKIIREVKLLSKLKHENVVRYYGSWIEVYSETENLMENNGKSRGEENGEDDEEDDDDDDDDSTSEDFSERNDEQEDSSFVVFQKDSKELSNCSPSAKKESLVNNPLPVRTLYIQMEFCEKSTLKYAIKNNLYEQEARHWRLLREIVEGLTYIHKQGLIHRDLKPDNIFLDSKDHVKIGDFGLAKIRGISKCTLVISEVPLGGGDNDYSHYTQGDSDTAGVGTSYYVAPEMDSLFEKSHYNEKVDIYSLGIIFFEMCHPPFNTGMERHDILMKLRRTEIIIPSAMEESMPEQMELVRKLLNRDPASRPTSQEILEDHVPPAEVEFEELKEIIRKTLISPETKGYKYLISSCLNQKMNIDEDIAYQMQNFHPDKFYMSLEKAKEVIENIFKSRGAVYLSTVLLLPQTDVYANDDARVKLMTQSGAVVNLSYDLRVPFARYVISKNVRRFRRYTIDRVHREQKLHDDLPKELYECAFDIVSPKSGNISDELEVLSVVDEIINGISSLKTRNCVLLLNHALILNALLIYFGIEKVYGEIFRFLMDAKTNKYARRQLETNLLSLELGIYAVNTLVKFFGKEYTIHALKEELLSLFISRRDASEKAEKGFNKLIEIISEAENYGISIPIRIRLDVVCNTIYCCDVMFDIICKTKQKRGKQTTEVIMSGCRYDGLLRNLRKLSSDVKETNQSAVGVSIFLDKIVPLLKEDNVLSEHVVVCSTDIYFPTKEKVLFIKELRESGIKCYFEDAIDNMDELMEYCGENKITHIVNLKEENGPVYVLSWDADKCLYREKKINRREVAEYILKNSEDQGIVTFQRSENRTCPSDVSTVNQSLNIHIMSEEKSQTRRKYENQIKSKISPILRHFSSKTRVEVVGVDLDETEIARLVMSFKYDDSSSLSKILSIADRSSKKTYLSKICAKLESFFTPDKSSLVIVIYGLNHDKYQLIIG